MAKTFQDLVADSKARIREVTVHEVKEKIDTGHEFLLVDVREESEWAAGRLATAMHLGRGILERDAAKVLTDPAEEIILYCRGGLRSALGADVLQQMGYSNVASMLGGYRQWLDEGLDIVEGP